MKWILVKDKLPEVQREVLVCDGKRNVFISSCVADPIITDDKPMFVHDLSILATDVKMFITHWMPLPAPPSEPSNEITLTREWLEWEKKRRESMIKDSVESDKEWKEYLKGRLAQINDIIKMMEE